MGALSPDGHFLLGRFMADMEFFPFTPPSWEETQRIDNSFRSICFGNRHCLSLLSGICFCILWHGDSVSYNIEHGHVDIAFFFLRNGFTVIGFMLGSVCWQTAADVAVEYITGVGKPCVGGDIYSLGNCDVGILTKKVNP